VGLTAKASRNRISTGVRDLDKMLGGKGYYDGSTILVSGGAGTGKTSLASQFAVRACRDHKKVLYFVFEESADQVVRNMRSIGLDLGAPQKSGKLMIQSHRPSAFGLEMHLAQIHRTVDRERPEVVVIDPISALAVLGNTLDIKHMLIRTVDYLKMKGITVMLTELRDQTANIGGPMISSLADTWIVLDSVEMNGEKNRLISVVKSRGMSHSNQVREMMLTDDGVKIVSPHVSSAGVLTGTARFVQEMREQVEQRERTREVQKLRSDMRAAREKMNLEMKTMKVELEAKETELAARLENEARLRNGMAAVRRGISQRRTGNGRGHGAR
jgi:circadian clock protein KaiC